MIDFFVKNSMVGGRVLSRRIVKVRRVALELFHGTAEGLGASYSGGVWWRFLFCWKLIKTVTVLD